MTSRTLGVLAIALVAGCAPEAATPPATPPETIDLTAGHHHHGPGDHHHQQGGPGHEHHHGGPLVHRFENAEQWVKEFDGAERDAWQHPADVIAALEIAPGMHVADVGAGTGYFLPHLSRAVGPKGKVLGLDIEASMVEYMTKRAAREGLANVEARVVATDDPKLADGSVDRVLIVDTWHHIPERVAYATKLAKALKPGGAVFVVDFKRDAKKGPPPNHRIAPEEVMAELKKGGLSPEIVDVKLPEQYVVAGRR
jgi:cyclopropane fatty-acyl-phospholipid synthase-like methyltransferase